MKTDLSNVESQVASISSALSAVEEGGAKNQLVYPYNETTVTKNEITFTDNGDGSITISGVAAEGTVFWLSNARREYSNVILSGIDSAVQGLVLGVSTLEGGWNPDNYLYGGEKYFSSNKHINALTIGIDPGTDFSNPVTVYPMIRDARITNSTYVPYAMTNVELTKKTTANSISDPINISQWRCKPASHVRLPATLKSMETRSSQPSFRKRTH